MGAILVDNVASSPPPGLGGTDPTVTISSVRISLADGAKLKSALATRSRLHAGVFVNLDANPTQLQGADETGRLLLYTPQPLDSGFSIAHWDQSAIRDLLMEPPPVAAGLTHSVTAPQDLTMYLLKDIGW